jgi:hypothetical protein
MRTPAGKECRFYYEDFHRRSGTMECRLVKANPASMHWQPRDCSKCPVPDILNANASKDMELTLTIKPKLLGLGRELHVTASCIRHRNPIQDPYIGCVQCNENRSKGLDLFRQALEQSEDD